MSILFKPNGSLNISTDPSNLPHTIISQSSVYSEAMQRCKNIRLDRVGKASTRYGSSKVTSTIPTSGSANTPVYIIIHNNGVLVFISGTRIHDDDGDGIATMTNDFTDAQWYGVRATPLDGSELQVFMTNGTDFLRFASSSRILTWGITPTTLPL